jgi:nicotinamide riboside transporter PnuC
VYPQVLIPIFLLFMAVLTYGWFYWQRAKARGVVAEGSADHSAE